MEDTCYPASRIGGRVPLMAVYLGCDSSVTRGYGFSVAQQLSVQHTLCSIRFIYVCELFLT
jgi:hypothetical protein